MFMTDYELVYGKDAGKPSAYTGPLYHEEENNKENKKENKKNRENLKRVGNTLLETAKNANNYLKSDEFSERVSSLKEKTKSVAKNAGSVIKDVNSDFQDRIKEKIFVGNEEDEDYENNPDNISSGKLFEKPDEEQIRERLESAVNLRISSESPHTDESIGNEHIYESSDDEQLKPVVNLKKSENIPQDIHTETDSEREQLKPLVNIKKADNDETKYFRHNNYSAKNNSPRKISDSQPYPCNSYESDNSYESYSGSSNVNRVADTYDDERYAPYNRSPMERRRFYPNTTDRYEERMENNYGSSEQAEEKSGTVIVLVIIIILLLVALGVMGGIFLGGKYFSQNRSITDISDNFQGDNNAQPVPAEVITTVADEFPTADENGVIAFQTGFPETVAPAEEKAQPTPQPEFTLPKVNIDPVSVSNDSVKSNYLNIVNNANMLPPNKGFLVDLNGDGINEMILTNPSEMNYIMYYFSGSTVKSCKFGGYNYLDSTKLFKVDGNNGEKYIYYKCEAKYQSPQGYFHLNSHTTLHISINYPESNGSYSADWSIRFSNGETYATGNEAVKTFYAQPANCHSKLMSALSHYKYSIDEGSKYTKLDELYKDDLINALGGNKKVEKPAVQPQTQPPAPTYSCNKKGQLNTHGGVVSGYATSYVVNNGASSKIRDSLGNAWHVTAVQYCESRGVLWYELYDTDDGDYYGWVDVNFIDFYSSNSNSNNNTVSQSVQVSPCYRTGQINGSGVAGFTTSYVVNGGAISTVRDVLGDTWHVTAVNTCTSRGVVWYELYDTDDNDYYGWVDANYIRFY